MKSEIGFFDSSMLYNRDKSWTAEEEGGRGRGHIPIIVAANFV